jgi:hypothetical protein
MRSVNWKPVSDTDNPSTPASILTLLASSSSASPAVQPAKSLRAAVMGHGGNMVDWVEQHPPYSRWPRNGRPALRSRATPCFRQNARTLVAPTARCWDAR